MERVLERCAGLDVHKKTVTVCVRVPGASGDRVQQIRTFGTTTAELLTLRDWLEAHRVSHVAMESTGVYWRPVFYVLEEAFTCILANATQIAQVPGRKTDVNDAAWIAQLLECGLIRASFVPPQPIRELRDLTRYRKLLIQERTRHANRLHKVLEDTGIKLTSVPPASSAPPVAPCSTPSSPAPPTRRPRGSGPRQAAQEAARLATGPARPLPRPPCFPRQPAPRPPRLPGRGHRDRQLPDRYPMAPFAEQLARLDTIRGVNKRTAEVLIAELGPDMSVFPTAKHAASWAGLCPGNHESAGKHRSGRTRHGNRWLRAALIEAALAASVRSTTGAFAARYRRVRHRGHKKAIVAVAHAILVTAYHLLARQTTYQDPGADYYDRRHAERVRHRAIQTLERQGYRVTLEPAA